MQTPKDYWSRAAESYAAGLLLVYFVMLWSHAAPPSLTDCANWAYQGVLLRNHLTGVPDTAHLLKRYPVPNSLATVLMGLLNVAMPWKAALKTLLSAELLTFYVVLRRIMHNTYPAAATWLVLPQAILLNVNFWYGFINFQFGLCWVLLMTSLLLERGAAEQQEPAREWVFGALLLLSFFTHMVAFVFCGLLLLLYTAQKRRFSLLWQLVPGGLATVWYVAGRYLLAGNADGQAGMTTTVRTFSGAFWAYKVNSYLKSFGFINPGLADGSQAITVFGRGPFVVLFAVNLLVALVLGWAMVWSARRAWRLERPERFVWTAIVAMLPLALVVPGTALGLADPGSRLLQVGLAPALALCKWPSKWMRAAAGGSILMAASGTLLLSKAGFEKDPPLSNGEPLPRALVGFAHAPNHDQDRLYRMLDRGEMGAWVFPTGLFLNQKQ